MRVVFETMDDLRLLRTGDELDHKFGRDGFDICKARVRVTGMVADGDTGIAVLIIKLGCVGARADPKRTETYKQNANTLALPGELSRSMEPDGQFLETIRLRREGSNHHPGQGAEDVYAE